MSGKKVITFVFTLNTGMNGKLNISQSNPESPIKKRQNKNKKIKKDREIFFFSYHWNPISSRA